MTTETQAPDPARDVMDEDGENRAVRAFLMLYGAGSPTAAQMAVHMRMIGFDVVPEWVERSPGHLTKGGAQLWLRQLFALEAIPAPEGAEPFWHAVVSKRAPVIDKAIRREDVASEYADKCRDNYPDATDIEVVPLYRAAPAPQAAPCVVDGVLYSRSVVKRLAVQMGLVQEAPVALTRQQVKALMQEAGYDQAGPSARADFISGVRHAEQAHGIPAPKEPTNGR